MNLKQIESLAKQDRYEEAFAECEKLLQDTSEEKADVLRVRAYVYARSGDYEKALHDRETIFQIGGETIRDYYLAADNALSSGKFAQAITWFKEVLQLGEKQNETWFKSASYFLMAYAQMELGQYKEASQNLDNAIAVEGNVAMPVPGMCGLCNHRQLREEINSREARAK